MTRKTQKSFLKYKEEKAQDKIQSIRLLLSLIFFLIIIAIVLVRTNVYAQESNNKQTIDNIMNLQILEENQKQKLEVERMANDLYLQDIEQAENRTEDSLKRIKDEIVRCSTFQSLRGYKVTAPTWFTDLLYKLDIKDCKRVSFLSQIAHYESNFNPLAKNKTSSAMGLMQYLNSSWNAKWNIYRNESVTNAEAQIKATNLKVDLFGGVENVIKSGYWSTGKFFKF